MSDYDVPQDVPHVAECNDDVAESPKETAVKALRDPITGQFLKGTAAGPGRPKGSRDRLNVQVIETLEKLWSNRGAEIIDQLAAEKPEVVAQLIARLIPQELATQAITGVDETTNNSNHNKDIRITLVQQVSDATAITHNDISNEVQGELLDHIH
jgi:hypothetical protein